MYRAMHRPIDHQVMKRYSMGAILEFTRIMEHEPREEMSLVENGEKTPPLQTSTQMSSSFSWQFWEIVTTLQEGKVFCKASWKGESLYRSQGPSAQGRSMSLLQDTSVSEADAVEPREAHILYTRLLGCLLAQSVPTAANKAMEAT